MSQMIYKYVIMSEGSKSIKNVIVGEFPTQVQQTTLNPCYGPLNSNNSSPL